MIMLTFIVNPNSGGEHGFQVWKDVERRLKQKKIPYKVFITDGPGDATKIAREVCEDTPDTTIVAVGGDGTFNEILNGLKIEMDPVVGYIPTGSGNDLARGLGFSNNPVKCLNRILERKNVRSLDYGVLSYGTEKVQNRRFAVSTGIGYDAAVCFAIRDYSEKGKAGSRNKKKPYTMIGAAEIFRTKTSRGYVVLDDEKKVEFNDVIFISSQIHVTEGGGKKFTPTADPQDGELTLCIMHSKSKFRFIKLLYHGLNGNHLKYPGVRTYNCKHLKIHLENPKAVHADGELFGKQTDVEVRCVPGKLKIIV